MATRTSIVITGADVPVGSRPSWSDYEIMQFARDFLNGSGLTTLENNNLKVEESDTPGQSVKVNTGVCWVEIAKNSKTYKVRLENLDIASLDLTQNNSGSTRYDLIVARIDTASEPDVNSANIGKIEVVEGTPGAGTPALPSNAIALAHITCVNGFTAINNAQITDQRLVVKIIDTNIDYKITAKGDLIVGDSSGKPVKMPASTLGKILLSDPGQSNGLKWGDIGDVSMDGLTSKNLTFGESIDGSTTPRAVCIKLSQDSTGSTTIYENDNNIGLTDVSIKNTDTYRGQNFNLPYGFSQIKSASIEMKKVGSPDFDIVVELYNTDAEGKPTGSPLVSATRPANTLYSNYNDWTFTFPAHASLSVGKYAIMIKAINVTTLDDSNYINIEYDDFGYENVPNSESIMSSNGGSTYSTSVRDLRMSIDAYDAHTNNGRIFKSADTNSNIRGFIGFTKENKTTGQIGVVQFAGVINGFSGLTPGAMYRLSTNPGEIEICQRPSIGNPSDPLVGRALSATELKIESNYY